MPRNLPTLRTSPLSSDDESLITPQSTRSFRLPSRRSKYGPLDVPVDVVQWDDEMTVVASSDEEEDSGMWEFLGAKRQQGEGQSPSSQAGVGCEIGCYESKRSPSKAQFFSEFEILTHPNIAPHPHLLIRRDYLHRTGFPLPSKGDDGVIHVKEFFHPNVDFVAAAAFYTQLKNLCIPKESTYPLPDQPELFRECAAMVFMEDLTRFTSSGEPIFEFLGNFYIRKLDFVDKDGTVFYFEFVRDPSSRWE
ncbi:hypothetical protein CC1G_13989 [Coprinopsis cinerea okayama7|uniref:Uncharacterized protein n=1 Tax=Coprinopsis cinerea (strain Okayama-7 / 130 / ATCC MYA-4618 / FGSC 9003) TaxID=240176 RepID=D6RKZ6_COPC7|nr:hypothetical protein CC1G_13989 [Coprinopsis cinerea okayama7\|eukprot:XP_002911950.1 hypothetical protein CC1G_13989 [Coprinopsis cinerea okayama7\